MREWTSMICVESLHHQTFLFSLTVLLLAVLKDETSTDVASSSIPCPPSWAVSLIRFHLCTLSGQPVNSKYNLMWAPRSL